MWIRLLRRVPPLHASTLSRLAVFCCFMTETHWLSHSVKPPVWTLCRYSNLKIFQFRGKIPPKPRSKRGTSPNGRNYLAGVAAYARDPARTGWPLVRQAQDGGVGGHFVGQVASWGRREGQNFTCKLSTHLLAYFVIYFALLTYRLLTRSFLLLFFRLLVY